MSVRRARHGLRPIRDGIGRRRAGHRPGDDDRHGPLVRAYCSHPVTDSVYVVVTLGDST